MVAASLATVLEQALCRDQKLVGNRWTGCLPQWKLSGKLRRCRLDLWQAARSGLRLQRATGTPSPSILEGHCNWEVFCVNLFVQPQYLCA